MPCFYSAKIILESRTASGLIITPIVCKDFGYFCSGFCRECILVATCDAAQPFNAAGDSSRQIWRASSFLMSACLTNGQRLQVEGIVRGCVQMVIGDAAFHPNKLQGWTDGILEEVLKRLAELARPFKFVVTVRS